MAPIKKIKTIKLNILDKIEVIEALEIRELSFDISRSDDLKQKELNAKQLIKAEIFYNKYKHSWDDTTIQIWRWHEQVFKGKNWIANDELYQNYLDCINRIDQEPIKTIKYEKKILLQKRRIGTPLREAEWTSVDTINSWKIIDKNETEQLPLETYIYTSENAGWIVKSEVAWKDSGYEWIFKENVYEIFGDYTDEQARLLVLEAFDKERTYFEKLKTKYDSESLQSSDAFSRPRIPENIRIEVWRRDGGKCARCESREKLEYDHIVPISRGGSNTARNIELLCEKHNRSKSNNVV